MSRKKYDQTEDFLKGLGSRIKQALGTRRQVWLSNELGVDQPRVSEWINGRHQIELDTLVRIAEVLGCSLDWLLRGEEVGKPIPKMVNDIHPGYGEEIDSAISALRDVPEHAGWVNGLLRIFKHGDDDARQGIQSNIDAFLGDLGQPKVRPTNRDRKKKSIPGG